MKLKMIKRIFFLVFIIAFGFHLCLICNHHILNFSYKFVLISIQLLSLVGVFICEKEHKKWVKQLIFIWYVFHLIYVLFFDAGFGRNPQSLAEFEHINLVPLHTIRLFIHGYQIQAVSLFQMMLNIIGNMCLFMPWVYALTTNCALFQKDFVCFLFMGVFIALIEVLQVIFLRGTGDIDDWLLNMIGVIVMFYIVKIVRLKKE